jgi:hypothetical protein
MTEPMGVPRRITHAEAKRNDRELIDGLKAEFGEEPGEATDDDDERSLMAYLDQQEKRSEFFQELADQGILT